MPSALLAFGALEPLSTPGSPEYIALAALLALLVGVFRILLGLLRLGGVAYLLSEPVLTGFTTAAAILILSSQLPKVFDVTTDGDGVLADALQALTSTGEWQWPAIGFAAMTLVLMFGGRRLHTLFPGVLVAVVVGVIVSGSADYDGSTVGELDGGFVSLTFDFPWDRAGDVGIPALVFALVGFGEPSSIARTLDAQGRERWDANREMVPGCRQPRRCGLGCVPGRRSFSRSSLNKLAGATSAWAGAITGAFVLLALPLTPLLESLPNAILGAIVVGAVAKLIRLDDLWALLRANRVQALVGVGTLAATLASAPRVERGVMVGVGLALLAHLYRELSVTTPSVRRATPSRLPRRGAVVRHDPECRAADPSSDRRRARSRHRCARPRRRRTHGLLGSGGAAPHCRGDRRLRERCCRRDRQRAASAAEVPPPISSINASAGRYQVIGWWRRAPGLRCGRPWRHLRADLLPQFRQLVVHNRGKRWCSAW